MERPRVLRIKQPARLPADKRRLLRATHVPYRNVERVRRPRVRTASVASYTVSANRNSVTFMACTRLATVAGLQGEARL